MAQVVFFTRCFIICIVYVLSNFSFSTVTHASSCTVSASVTQQNIAVQGTAKFIVDQHCPPNLPCYYHRGMGAFLIRINGSYPIVSNSLLHGSSATLSGFMPRGNMQNGQYTVEGISTDEHDLVGSKGARCVATITIDNTPIISNFSASLNAAGLINLGGSIDFFGVPGYNIGRINIWIKPKTSNTWSPLKGMPSYVSTFDLSSIPVSNFPFTNATDFDIKLDAHSLNGSKSSAFTSISRTPVRISITLDKQSYVPCEGQQATINVTSNDPTPNGGTVTLTLPNGSTASAAFTGKTAALTLADFGLPATYLGTFQVGDISTWNASVSTTAGKTASATASANIIAGGLTIQMNPYTAMIEPELQDRPAIKVGGKQNPSARTQDIQIKVLDPSGAAVLGAQVNASLELFPGTETFEGHDHGVNGRPLSTLGSLTPIKEINGTYNTTYSSSIYASKAQIRVTATDPATQCTAKLVSKPFIAQISGLSPFSNFINPNILTGGVCRHHGPSDKGIPANCTSPNNNHSLRAISSKRLIALQRAYIKTYPNRTGLRFNDASLPKGGKFEAFASGLWASKTKGTGHETHDRGTDIDLGYRLVKKGTVTIDELRSLNKNAPSKLFRDLYPEGNHVHIYLE